MAGRDFEANLRGLNKPGRGADEGVQHTHRELIMCEALSMVS